MSEPEKPHKCGDRLCRKCFPYDEAMRNQVRAERKRTEVLSRRLDMRRRAKKKASEKTIFMKRKDKIPKDCMPFVSGQTKIGDNEKNEL